MGRFKGINFDKEFLNSLKDDQNSGVEIERTIHHLALHPVSLNNFSKSVKELLSEGITKYHKDLGGILLGFQNVTMPAHVGSINNDSCYIHLDVEADFFVFKPEIGKELQGVVNRISKDYVGILVYKAFNVSLPMPEDEENWLGNKVTYGYEVLVSITHINLSSYFPYLKGELISILTQSDSDKEEESILDKTPILKKSKKKKKSVRQKEKSSITAEDFEDEEINELEDASPQISTKKKKSKEKKTKQHEVSLTDLNLSELFSQADASETREVGAVNKKSKKKKKVEAYETIGGPKIKAKNKKHANVALSTDLNSSELFLLAMKNVAEDEKSSSENKTPRKKRKLENEDENTVKVKKKRNSDNFVSYVDFDPNVENVKKSKKKKSRKTL